MRIPPKRFKQNDGLGKICDLQNCCPSVIRITQTLKKSAVVLAATVWWIASVILYSYLKPAYHFTNNVTSVSIIDCAGIFEFIKYFMFLTEILRLWCWRRQAEHLWALIYSSRWQLLNSVPPYESEHYWRDSIGADCICHFVAIEAAKHRSKLHLITSFFVHFRWTSLKSYLMAFLTTSFVSFYIFCHF